MGYDMVKYCKLCGKEFSGKAKHFCSRECWIKQKDIDKNNHFAKNHKTCIVCGKWFRGNNGLYCSNKCYKSKIMINIEERSCLFCGEKFLIRKTLPKKFHSHSCVTKYQMLNEDEKKKRNIKRKETIKLKYGVNDSSNIPGSREKWKKTMVSKYGSTSYTNLPKRIKTNGENKLKNIIKVGLWEPMFNINEYNGVRDSYKFKCKKCGEIFNSNLVNVYPRCEKCFPKIYHGTSESENDLYNFVYDLLQNKTTVVKNDRTILSDKKELDILIPDLKIGIEFDGLYWHCESEGKDKNYHLSKTKECENKGIRLIHIFEDEWLYKQEIVKSRLRIALNNPSKELIKIHARKCIIKELSSKQKNFFLESNHLQGKDASSFKFGAFYGDELISVMTFSKPKISMGHKNIESKIFELNRFCVKKNTISSGIAQRLLAHFIKLVNPNKIISYSDNRWNTGNLYEKLGFKLVSRGSPNYWYIKDRNRVYRYNFRKDMLPKKLIMFDNNLTEYQNMQLNGYERIWDCGSNKYEINLRK